ncbi:hypothetical protein EMPS_11197 [Entomortierella parvispora]|uniref:Putative gamma-glutamylcyclotransferase n=1 Tax=Entomortierella parvispora TaxID=205924 RepID=A0A9P3HLR6_9FUNG|nr:hypothetical protein EMPS_11197 [Entomortierella parvispora]
MTHSIAIDNHPSFVYGSLRDPRVLNSVTRPGPEANVCTVRGLIHGFTRHPYHNEPYPGMIASEDKTQTVDGLLLFGLTIMDRFRLDQFEGSEYTREVLSVQVLDPVTAEYNPSGPLKEGDMVTAYVYVFTGPVEHLDRTRSWDYEAFQREQVAKWIENDSHLVEGDDA